jgi:hypothetical protein
MIGAFLHGFAFAVGIIAGGLSFILLLGLYDQAAELASIMKSPKKVKSQCPTVSSPAQAFGVRPAARIRHI